MGHLSEYRKAFDAAKQELSDLLDQQKQTEKRLVVVRQSINTLATLCESEGVEVDGSPEAAYLLADSTLAVEIRRIFGGADWNTEFRPSEIKNQIERLGRDLSTYQNPQATIHMILKRMVESDEIQEKKDREGKLVYRMQHPLGRKVRFPKE